MTNAERIGAALAAYAVVAALAGDRGGPVLCPYRRTTGRSCFACGLSRSIARTVRGDLRGAAAAHPDGPAVAVACVAAGLVAATSSRRS